MLTISSNQLTRDCEGYSRRDLLRIGALGLGGLTVPGLLQARAQAAEAGHFVKDKAVLFVFLRGGPTQFETFDPKMSAPEEYRAMHGEVKTKLPGVTFGSHFEKLAARADRLAVVRSFSTGTGSHGNGRDLITGGGNSMNASMGALYARLAGSTNPQTGMPTNALITPNAVGKQHAKLRNSAPEVLRTGALPSEYQAFQPGASSGKNKEGLISDMQLRVSSERLADRRYLLNQVGELQRGLDKTSIVESFDKFQSQAFNVILGGVTEAFDLSNEDPKMIERYDTSHCKVDPKFLKKGTNNAKKIPEFSPVALGKQMLLARRLIEAGCGFVTVTSSGWDMHGNAFGIDDGMPTLGPALDHAVATFLDDIEERGMSDKVLVVIAGEMGRTPKINNKRGRDHWGSLSPLMLAGGGLPMGQVIGQSDSKGNKPATDPYSVHHLLTTIMSTMFDVGELRLVRGLPTDIVRTIAEGQPIRELFV